MKKITITLTLILSLSIVNAQKTTIDFEDLLSNQDSFLNGSTTGPSPRIFTRGALEFPCEYDTASGGYWKSGFAVSSMRDTVDGSYSNLYSARSASGALNSMTYLVGQQNSYLRLRPNLGTPAKVTSLYISNTTYAYTIMKDGNRFSNKFSATKKDSFVLFIYSGNGTDSVRVDLANFTHTDTTKNFVLKDWIKVEVPNFFDTIRFKLVSSDNGQFGMNTPAFFVVDNVTIDFPNSVKQVTNSNFNLYPNPSNSFINIKPTSNKAIENVKIFDVTGSLVLSTTNTNTIDISHLPNGLYTFLIKDKTGFIETQKVVKQ